jgi:folate-binding protein YgfZ
VIASIVAHPSPMQARHDAGGAAVILLARGGDDIPVPAQFGPFELEYASIRKDAALIDQPHRGVVEVEGAERADFLNRMLTQEVASAEPGTVRRAFRLARTGRIEADVRVLVLPGRILLEIDALDAPATAGALARMIFAEDVRIEDRTRQTHRLALHGPGARDVLMRAGAAVAGGMDGPGSARETTIDGAPAVLFREDAAGEEGYELVLPASAAAGAYEVLAAHARPTGWHAFNVARIEAGTPLFHVDFGPDSLPHETGVFEDRVSLRKGCYPGQEIVARMQSRGQVKARLAALRAEEPLPPGAPQPATGDLLFSDAEPERPAGAITSSAMCPMLSQALICFAMVRRDLGSPGTILATGGGLRLRVQPDLASWRRS